MAGTLFLGTSGFAYPEWKGTFYPAHVRPRDMLPYYAGRFRSVEINYTFRHEVTEETLAAWAAATPETFVFAIKAHQLITHSRRLREVRDEVSLFLERVSMLGPRLGPILFQCPPTLPFDGPLIEAFLAYLPPWHRYAFEFRHPSWLASRDLLTGRGAAWCVSETDESAVIDEHLAAWPFVYLRLRKTEYSDDELREWAGRIQPALDGGATIFCYFKHEDEGASPKMAKRLEAMLPS